MKFLTERQDLTLGNAPSAVRTLDISSKSFWITGMLLDLELAKTDGAGPTTCSDWLYRAITNLQISGGGRIYAAIGGPDLRSLYWATRLRMAMRHRMPDMQAGAVTFHHTLPLIFGVNPVQLNDGMNEYDPSAAIAPDSDVQISVTWAANTAIGANRTVGAGTILRVTLFGIVPEREEEVPKFYPKWKSTTWGPTQAFPGLSGFSRLDPGSYYRRSTVMILNGASPADNRNDGLAAAAISEVGVETADGRKPLKGQTYDVAMASQGQCAVQDDNSTVVGAALAPGVAVVGGTHNAGVFMVDWVKLADTSNPAKAHPVYGLNMVNKKDSTAKLVFTVDTFANTNVVMLHEGYLPYT